MIKSMTQKNESMKPLLFYFLEEKELNFVYSFISEEGSNIIIGEHYRNICKFSY